ncbi:MAG: SEC-C domain-containing protein [Actinomycetota bacterium]|nr:SEC-C domain-containing protein [Actinomycetota bacterium]
MAKIGRNEPCPCGSGKKYKNCCLKKSEAVDILNYKYDRYLSARNNACAKVFKTGAEELGLGREGPTFYLLEFLLCEVDMEEVRNKEDLEFFVDNLSFIFTIFGYPIYDLSGFEGEPDDFGFNTSCIENNYLWRFCLKNHPSDFNQEEIKFLQSLNQAIAGFFKVLGINAAANSQGYPVIEIQDIFTKKTYKIMDKSLSEGVVKHDILSGIIAPFAEDIWVMESCPPVVYQLQDKQILMDLIEDYSKVYRDEYGRLIGYTDDYGNLFKMFPVIIYLVALDYFIMKLSSPLPRMVNYDKEEIVFSETIYKFENKKLVKEKVAGLQGVVLSEDLKSRTVFSWLNEKDTVMGTIVIKRKKLYFTTNSLERLERWKGLVKKIPIQFVKTDFTSVDEMREKYSEGAKSGEQGEIKDENLAIPEEDLKRIALEWWENYYNQWVDMKIPALGNITPRQAVKNKSGREKVEELIDEFENSYLRADKDSRAVNNFQKYFDPNELRKRLSLA